MKIRLLTDQKSGEPALGPGSTVTSWVPGQDTFSLDSFFMVKLQGQNEIESPFSFINLWIFM